MKRHGRRIGLRLLLGVAILLRALPPAHAARGRAPQRIAAVEATLARLSVEQKVAQMLMIGFVGTELDAPMRRWVSQRRVGGVALFSRNLIDARQTAQLTADLQAVSAPLTPPFIAVDQEGGNVVRLREGGLMLPGSMALGATRDPKLAYAAGQSIGSDLRLLGFNMNLAPVLDVNSNPRNPVIGIRSYGERPELVGCMGEWFIRGQQEMGISAVAKHFPGHGDTQNDSHFSLPVIDASLAKLDRLELRPFRRAIGAGLDAIMTAHIALPRITHRRALPATLSHAVVTGLLRRRLGFDGIVMTDGLEMRGIAQAYGSARAAVMAVRAGADMAMILWEPGAEEMVYQGLLRAVRRGEIPKARLDASVRRILTAKWRRGLQRRTAPEPQKVVALLQRTPLHQQIQDQIAQRAVTLVRDSAGLLPLRAEDLGNWVVLAPPGPFGERLAAAGAQVVRLPMVPSAAQRRHLVARLRQLCRPGVRLLAGVVNRSHLDVVAALQRERPLPLAVVSFASPYYLQDLPQASTALCTYGYLASSQKAAAAALLGEAPIGGRLPVSLPQVAAYGSGLRRPARAAAATTVPAL